MNAPQRWQQVFSIFEAAVELPAAERPAFLDQACVDPEARHAVEDLLAADECGASPVDEPLAGHLPSSDASTEAAADSGEMGTIGTYRLLREVGQGGMSTVYLAVRADDAFHRRVVVKLVRQGMRRESILRRLRIERQILAGLDHPYVARLYDGGSTEAGLPYFVMEYVDGLPIDEYCEHNELSVAERLELFSKVCAAVRYAHQNLVVHRDIKPSNILVTADGDPKLLDFGIAKLLNPELASAEAEPTATWQRVMTPSYASPEQVGGRQITTASDIYSLGILLYKLLTGRLPRSFKGRSPQEIEYLLAETDPEPPSSAITTAGHEPPRIKELKRQLSGDLDAIVLKAMRSAPPRRYGSVERLVEDIERYLNGRPVLARAGTWRYRAGKFMRRHRLGVAVGGTVAVLLTAFAVVMAWQSVRIAQERDQARFERDQKQAVLTLFRDVFRFSNPFVHPGEELTVRSALERSVPVLESALSDQPVVRAELLFTSGAIHTDLGSYEIALTQLEEALAIRRELYGDKHSDVVEVMTVLAEVKKQMGEIEEAESLVRRAVEITRGLGGDPVDLAGPLTELVSVMCFQGEHAAAEGPAREALNLVHELPGLELQKILALEFMGQIHSSKGEYRDSASLYRQALTLRRQRDGEKHPDQINVLSNLALVLGRQHEFDAAERTYRELLELERATFGEDYPALITISNMAGLQFQRGNWSGARELYDEALAMLLEVAGADDWRVYLFSLNVERTRLREGAPAVAERNLRRLLEHWRPYFGIHHQRIAQGESILGESISTQGRCEAAEPFLVGSFQSLLEGAKHRHKKDAFERLRDHLVRCGRPGEIARYEAMLEAS